MRQNRYFKRALVAGGLTAIFAVLQASAALGAPPGAAVTASFSSSPATPVLGRPVTFQSISTTEAGHRFVILAWDLYGRNDFKDGTGTTATRTFGDPGTYTVKLFALDDRGQWAIASKTLTVVNQPPLAQFTSSPAAPLTG